MAFPAVEQSDGKPCRKGRSGGRWARNVWEATKSISCCGDWGKALGLLEAFVQRRLRLNHVSRET